MSDQAKDETSDRAITRTVSMPESLWAAFDPHAARVDGDRSSCIQRLVRSELRGYGLLPGSREQSASRLFRAAVEVLGVEGLEAVLRSATAERMTERAEVGRG